MLGTTRTLRDRSTSRDPENIYPNQDRSSIKEETKDKSIMDSWLEPSLSEKPSYRDQTGGSYYGVSEHMQPLGEAPNARVKTRVKADGARKSVLGRSAAAVGSDAQETPEGTPAPPSTSQTVPTSSPQSKIVVEDEDDDDYAPKAAGKKKERAARPRAVKRQSEVTPAPASTKPTLPKASTSTAEAQKRKYNKTKVKAVVEEAKRRANDVGKPELAAAVNEIYLQSLNNPRLMELLQAILNQSATPTQTAEFQEHVRRAKRKLRDEKDAKAASRALPKGSNGTKSLPLRSPSKLTPVEPETSAIPSTETTNNIKPKSSSKVKSPSKHSSRHRRPGHTGPMSTSPSKARAGSPDSDSSLTDMTSNPDDDMDVDEPDLEDAAAPEARTHPVKVKDHAAERGSLAAPNRNMKRSSADAELEEQEQERVLASKKQKLNETVARDYRYEESNVRGPPPSAASRLRSRTGMNATLAPPTLSVTTNGGRNASGRSSRAVSSDLDSPLSEPATSTSSRQSTPHVYKVPTKPFGKRAKTKQS
ncbi:hypothetical protein LTR37_011172 [Vermiconidia calcicola]|uniref:Uncharacterized protein n=1 Tax=Vermiconidia calcicola TaxID=1690605 RepID=A0ACC3N2Y7_9PEZI|nr:hypothetical protein LTR37_011172 [Vermiconidia calcicola]